MTMSDTIHRILSGQSLSRKELIGAGIFVMVWFLMDVVQFVDMIVGKFHGP